MRSIRLGPLRDRGATSGRHVACTPPEKRRVRTARVVADRSLGGDLNLDAFDSLKEIDVTAAFVAARGAAAWRAKNNAWVSVRAASKSGPGSGFKPLAERPGLDISPAHFRHLE